jgi:glycine betaine/proline transport system ATP-binding protein
LENRDIMEEKRKIKIKVEDLIFGKRKQEALALLKKGFQRRNPEEDKMYLLVNNVSFEIMEGEILYYGPVVGNLL